MSIIVHGEEIRKEIIESCKASLERGKKVLAKARKYIEERKAEEEKKKLH